jgi:hypothetical protein
MVLTTEEFSMEFFKNNWIAMLSLVIALIGGVPGIISVANYFKNRPILSYSLVNLITGVLLDETTGKEMTIVFLTGTISNEGPVTLTPAYFELEGNLGTKILNFEKRLIPEKINFGSEKQNILVTDPSKNDLQKFNSTFSNGMPLYGHLLFYTCDVGLNELRSNLNSLKLTLICVDVFGKKHKAPVLLALNTKGNMEYPKHGLKILSKP